MSETIDLNKAVDLAQLLDKSNEEKATQLPKPSGYRIPTGHLIHKGSQRTYDGYFGTRMATNFMWRAPGDNDAGYPDEPH
jgi:hypothetical protein